MQADRMAEARALYEKDLPRTEAGGGMLFRYAIALFALGQESRGHQAGGPRGGQDLAMPHCTSTYQTVSVGVAGTAPNETQRTSDLVEATDAALR
jgi:hypothetical protein